jgi:hypothetical protein
MNEQAIRDAYNLFVGTGYTQSYEAFKALINSNPQALQDAYGLFVNTGYNQDVNAFKTLMGVGAMQPQQEVKKKEQSGTMELPSAGSSLASQSLPKPTAEVLRNIKIEQPSETTQMQINLPTKEDIAAMKQTLADQKKPTPKFYDEAINMITPDFIDQIEEVVVPQMNYQFGPMGFKFEESGTTGDWMIATAPNGQTKEFSLDPSFGLGAESTSNELKEWIKDNTNKGGLPALQSQYEAGNKRYTSQKEYVDATNTINKEFEDFKLSADTYFYENSKVEREIKDIMNMPVEKRNSPEVVQRYQAILAKQNELNARKQELQKRQETLSVKGKNYDATVGKYVMMQSEQGQDWGALLNSFLEGIPKSGATAVTNIMADIGGEMATFKPYQEKANTLLLARDLGMEVPLDLLESNNIGGYQIKDEKAWENWYNSLSAGEKSNLESKFKDQVKKEAKYGKEGEMGALEAVRKGYKFYLGSGTTEAYKEKRSEESFPMMALFGVTESLPSMIGGAGTIGWVQRGAQMYAQASDNIYQEMEKNPEFKDISENEKLLITAPIGIAEASLEAIGLRNVIANKGLMNKIILRAMGKAGATTTAKTFGELVQNEVESMGGRALLTAAGAALAEAETGGVQQVSEYAIKDIYNAIKEKDMFQTPDFLSAQYFEDIGKSAAAEALGGLILGIPSAASAAYTQKGYKGMSDVMFQGFEQFSKDDNLQSAFIVDLKNKVSRGEMSGQQAKDALNNYRNSVGLFRQLPDGLNTESKKEAMNLLKERRDLEQQIEGKEDNLVQKQKTRISEINAELQELPNKQTEQAKTEQQQPAGKTIIDGTRIQVAPPERRTEVLDNEEALAEALRNLDDQQAETFGFVDENGDTLDLRDNEDLIAQEYFDSIGAQNNFNPLTQSQMSAKTIVDKLFGEGSLNTPDVSWTNDLDDNTEYELNFQGQYQIPFFLRQNASRNNDGTFTVKAKGSDIKNEFKDEVEFSFDDNKSYTFDFPSMEAVPDQYRDQVQEIDARTEKTPRRFLGIPIGFKNEEVRGKIFRVNINGADAKKLKLQPQRAANAKDVAKNVAKSMASLFPDMPIMTFNNADEMRAYAAENFDESVADTIIGDEGGMIINDASGKPMAILVNDENADVTTLPHEAWHAILLKAFGENEALFEEFKNGIDKALRDNGMMEIVNELKFFASTPEYIESNMQAEEWLVQLGGLLTASGITQDNLTPQSKKLLTQIKEVFNSIAVKITGKPIFLEDATPDDVLEFMVAISDRMARGMDITEFFRETPTREVTGTEVSSKTQVKKQVAGENAKILPEGVSIIDGWYSPIEKRLKETKVEKQSANKWLTGGLIGKGDEAIYTGVKGWLEQMNPQSQVTKDQILNWLDNNRVEIVEVEKTAPEPSQEKVNRLKEVEDRISEIEEITKEKAKTESGRISESSYFKLLLKDDEYNSLEKERSSLLKEFSGSKDNTKYRTYQLPGERKNYKEVLVTLPKNKSEIERLQDLVIQANDLGEFDRANEIERRINKLKGDEFYSSHFNETNIAVHLRMNTRTDSDGNKVLFLEEVQSDWGQEGKKMGFVSKEISDKLNNLREKHSKSRLEFDRISDELDEQYNKKKKPGESRADLRSRDSEFNKLAYEFWPAELQMFEDQKAFDKFQTENRDLVPSGPFVSNTNAWVKLGLKIALREAEKQGVDYIAWTTGEQQNERYDLSKQVEKIDIEGLEDNVQLVDIKLPDGSTEYLEVENGIIRDGSSKGQRLDNVIGKEYAEKVISTPANENRVLEGEGLKMGGSGMKGFYDKIVPDVFKSLMKEITGSSADIETVNINGNQQQAITVTPETKAQVKKGIAKFQRPSGAALLEVQKIGQRYNINDKGFMPKQANEFALAKELARFGLGAKRSKVTPEGYGGSIYMTDAAGKFYNPMKVRKQRISLSGGRLNPNVNTIEGYDRMMDIVNNIISKSLARGRTQDEIMKNVMGYVTGPRNAVYQRANDSQREQLVRNIETEFGKRQKSAPSVGKILGTIKDITKITLPEKELLKQHFRDLAKGGRDAKRAFMQASDDLSLAVSELAKSGKISPKQLSNVIRKFSKVNMLNEDSINGFVDYMTKVFEDADYAEKIAGIRTKITKARGNLKSKIGVADAIANPMRKLLAVNPTLIPDDVFDKYLNIINMFSASQAVLPLKDISEISQDINDIFQSLDEQLSKSEELAIRFDAFIDKVVDEKNGKIQYADTVNKMEKDGVVTAEEAELMKKYKSVIFPTEKKEGKTVAEIQAENNALIKAITDAKINLDSLALKDERELADNIRRLFKPELLKQLTTAQLTNLIKLIDNINNGFMPHYGELTFEGLNAIKNATPVGEATLAAKLLPVTKIYNNLKSKLTKRTSTSEMVRSGGFFFVDQILGNFKAKVVFNALFEKISEANAVFTSQLGQVNKKLDSAKDAVVKSFKYDANKTLESSFRMMAYMIQLEYESNPGNKQVNPASAYIKETIKAIKRGKTMYGDKEIEMLERILDENGNVDKDALYNSFNKAEKNAIKTIREINDGLTDKAVYTAAVIRGQRIDALNNYVHLPVMSEYNPDDSAVATKVMDQYNSTMNPSTKGKNLIERTSGAKAINFDVFTSAQRGAKFTLLDYHMTTPIRTARKTLNEAENRYGDEFTKQQREIFNAMRDGFEEVVSNVLTNSFVANSTSDEVVIEISKQGYRAVLGSAFRFVAEFLSNIGFVMVAGKKSFIEGVKYFSVFSSPDGVKIMENVSSKQITRLFHGDTLSGKFIDSSMLNQASGVKSATAKGVIANKANQIYNMSLKKYKNGVELIADTLISTPDRVIMRPVWFGQFATEFKKQTGKDVDFKKIADNNETYMRENKDAIEAAKLRADEMSVLAGATDNPFMGMVKGSTKPNQGGVTKLLNIFNTYMTRFAMFEYTTARQGIYAAMGRGSISRAEGVALLAAVTVRMTVYTFLINAAAGGLAGLLGDEEEEDEKTLMQKVGQAFASTASSLLLGRNFGNATKNLVSIGVEEFNEAFLDDLRNGEYDPYKDQISFSVVPKDKKSGDRDFYDLLANMLGPFSPSIKALNFITKKILADEKKTPEAIKRSEDENTIRIPLEVLGNVGMIPLYKDVRREVMNELYKDLRTADKKAEDKKQAEKEMLHGYENREDMKRYDPELYDEVFGKNSPGYDAEQAKKKLKHEADSIERRIKDEFYDYVPKKKGGFGSKKFGESKSKRGGFGSRKFGQ